MCQRNPSPCHCYDNGFTGIFSQFCFVLHSQLSIFSLNPQNRQKQKVALGAPSGVWSLRAYTKGGLTFHVNNNTQDKGAARGGGYPEYFRPGRKNCDLAKGAQFRSPKSAPVAPFFALFFVGTASRASEGAQKKREREREETGNRTNAQ